MIPLQVELQRAVKATKDETMTVGQAAEHLKVNVEEVPMIVAQADDLKIIGNDAIIAKRDKTNGWLIGAMVMVLFFAIAVGWE
ncbi:hypothetical protein [Bacillus subtilis]|uniref:hypothetical protein n=1 Tax=Bacillus subtilis TaxID=1423 RepID=UPI000D682106|nr:hypothetical protein [Bacillus subtilis]MDH3082416.1 hypothetical protein [Bacillus subtilis]MDN4183682.1 hypothetical protein [Bacillus subtilis]PWI61037.1 hypothetical protein DCS65_06730 [Bacillus subtilis]QAT36334.1 hypothetical protein EQY76_09210 [Bacillus subtilis]QAW12369.1 hypothetical protein ETA10_09285 [Bacillus subtilis]